MIKQYRKKPVIIEAIQWDGTSKTFEELSALSWNSDQGISWDGQAYLYIDTLEGTMTANPGDWIIKGVKAEIYPCKQVIFEATYEEVVS